jgi:hypothetical protein
VPTGPALLQSFRNEGGRTRAAGRPPVKAYPLTYPSLKSLLTGLAPVLSQSDFSEKKWLCDLAQWQR